MSGTDGYTYLGRDVIPPKITAKVIDDNVIHVSYITKMGNDEYERIFYLDFNHLENVETHVYCTRNVLGQLSEKEHTELTLNFKDIPISGLIKWENGKKDNNNKQ